MYYDQCNMKRVATVRLDPHLEARLEKLAQATARSKSFLIGQAVQEYLDVNEWQVAGIREAIRQADEGRLTPIEQVRKTWEGKVARSLKRRRS